MMEKVKGFKAFNKGLECRGFKFEEGKTYEEKEAVMCKSGFHFCENPLDVLNYYDLCESEFAKVESHGVVVKNKEDSKISTTKIKIDVKIGLGDFIDSAVNFLIDFCNKKTKITEITDKDNAQQASSGHYAKQASSGHYAKQASSGHYAKQASSGHYAKQASSGDNAQQASSGYYAQQASSGDNAQQASSGYYAQQASSGHYAKQASSGDNAQQASSGHYAQQASSGDNAKCEINGKHSVSAAIGVGSKIKGKKGNWITLAEWKYSEKENAWIPVCVKSAKIDGKKIKEDVFYKLEGKKFVEA